MVKPEIFCGGVEGGPGVGGYPKPNKNGRRMHAPHFANFSVNAIRDRGLPTRSRRDQLL